MRGDDPLRIGTRGSLLATTQSRWVARRLEEGARRRVELTVIRTSGDIWRDRPLAEIGGKGLFTRELDQALLEERIDLAVHSLKDLPTDLPPGISIGAVPRREDPRDALIGPEGETTTVGSMASGARIGTSSLRRTALLRALRPDLEVVDLRGNLDTRIGKVDAGELDAVVLAVAGLRRMGWTARISEYLEIGSWLPAPGQGALAVTARSGDRRTAALLAGLDHTETRAAVTAERTLLEVLDAGCRLPVAALGLPFGGGLRLKGLVAHPDGMRAVRAQATGARDDARGLGRRVGRELVRRGADLLLGTLRPDDRDAGHRGRAGG